VIDDHILKIISSQIERHSHDLWADQLGIDVTAIDPSCGLWWSVNYVFNLWNLASGQTGQIMVTWQIATGVDSNQTGVWNTVTISSPTSDLMTGNNTSSVWRSRWTGTTSSTGWSTWLSLPLPSIDIIKTTSTPSVSSGSTGQYMITVTNNGQLLLTGVAVTDTIAPWCSRVIGTLWIGASTWYSCSLANITSTTTNTASVIGMTTWWVTVSDTATATIYLINATIWSQGGGWWFGWWSTWWFVKWSTGIILIGEKDITHQAASDDIPSCPYTDGDFQQYKETMRDIPRTWQTRDAIYSLLDHCVVHGKNGEGKQYGTYDRLTYWSMYKIIVRSLWLSFVLQQWWQHWALPYMQVAQQEWLLEWIDDDHDLDDIATMNDAKRMLKNMLSYKFIWQNIEQYAQQIDTIRTPHMLRWKFAKLVDYYILTQ
jgi:uncharacterized repeat protein (TIGR01451 family)